MSSAAVLARRPAPDSRSAPPTYRRIAGTGWRRVDLAVLVVTLGVCLVGLLVAYQGAAHTTRYSDQVGWIILGGASLMLGSVGVAFWILEGLRAHHERAARLRARAARLTLIEPAAAELARDAVVSVSGMKHFHRPACRLVTGKNAVPVQVEAASAAGLTSCGMCRP